MAASNFKSRLNDITLIKETLNLTFDELNGAIKISVVDTVSSDISGQTVIARNYDGPGNQISSTVGVSSKRGLDVNVVNLSAIPIEGSFTANVSGQTINVGNTVSVTGTVATNISGQSVNVLNTVSVTGTVATNISGQSVNVPNTVSVTGTVDISGQTVNLDTSMLATEQTLLSIEAKTDLLNFYATPFNPIRLYVYDDISKAVLDNIKTNTDALNSVSKSGTKLDVNVSGQTVNVGNTVSVTGTVDIMGQTVNIGTSSLATETTLSLINESTSHLTYLSSNNIDHLYTHDDISKAALDNIKTNTDALNSVSKSGTKLDVNVSGQTVNVGNTVSVTGTVATSISGQTVIVGNSVSVSGAVSVSNMITGFATENTLTSLNGKINADAIHTDSIKTVVDNLVTVSPIINESDYDLAIAGPSLYADSVPAFINDPQGHQGWYYATTNPSTNQSNVYYYGNNVSLVQRDIIYNTVESVFAIVDLNYIGSSSANLPLLIIGTKPTGSGDHIPGFAHSVQTYAIPASEPLLINEKVLLWAQIGTYTNYTLPDSLFPNIRRIKCTLSSSDGSSYTSLAIAYCSVNTQTGSQAVRYTLHNAGISFINGSSQIVNSWSFVNSKSRLAETNLSSLTVSGGILSTSVTGTVATNISGQTVNIGNTVSITGTFSADISGQTVNVGNTVSVTGTVATNISGQYVNVANIPTVSLSSGSAIRITNGVAHADVASISAGLTTASGLVSNSCLYARSFSSNQSLPLNCTITDSGNQSLDVNVANTVSVTGTVATNISGQTVNIGNTVSITGTFSADISGQTVNVGNTVSVTGTVATSISGQTVIVGNSVSVSGAVSVTGTVATNISGQTVNIGNTVSITGTFSADISGQTVNVGNTVSVTGTVATNISGQTVNVANVVSVTGTVATNISGQTVNISGQTVDTHMYGSNYDTVAPANNPVYVDDNGFLTATMITTVHDNIYLGRKNNVADLTFLSTGNGVWNTYNQKTTSEEGWYYTTTGIAHGSLLFYNNGGWGVVKDFPLQSDLTFSGISTVYSIFKNYKPTTQSGVRINVYSRPTGSGDFSATYKSKWVYTLKSGQFLATGVSYMLYYGNLAKVKNNDTECPRIEYELNAGLSEGTRANGEIVSHIEISIDDAAGTNLYQCLVVEGGVYSNTNRLINYYFTSDVTGESELANVDTRDFLTELTKTTDLGTGTTALDVQVQNFPTGFDANITNASINSNLYNGAGTTPITSTTVSTQNGIDSNIINTVSVTGTVNISGQSVNVANVVSVTGTVVTNISGQTVNVANVVSVTGTVATNISGQSVNVANVVSVTGTVATNISGQYVNVTGLTYTGSALQTVDSGVATAINNLSAKQVVTPYGSKGNILDVATLAAWSETSVFQTNNNYGSDCIFTYSDTTTSATADIIIQGSIVLPLTLDHWVLIGLLTPITKYDYSGNAVGRFCTTRINVSAFNYLSVRNHGSVALAGVVCSIFAGKPAGVI